MARTAIGGKGNRSKVRAPNELAGLSAEVQIDVLANAGLTKVAILRAIMESRPELLECVEDNEDRVRIAAIHGITDVKKIPPFNQKAYRRLYEQAGKVQSRVGKTHAENTLIHSGEKSAVFRLDEVEYVPVHRINTGFPMLDWIFGRTEEFKEHGMPRGVVSLLCGSPGVGKSRLLIQMSEAIGQAWKAKKGKETGGVLYFQDEVSPTQFRGMTRGVISPDANFRFTAAHSIVEHIEHIKRFRPDVVFVDSMQMIAEATNAAGLVRCINTYKAMAQEFNFHALLIGQLNKAGEISGSRKFEHLVDICMKAQHWHIPGHFSVSCPTKNRFGSIGRLVEFKHLPVGVVCADKRKIDPKTFEAMEGGEMSILHGIQEAGGDVGGLDVPPTQLGQVQNDDGDDDGEE